VTCVNELYAIGDVARRIGLSVSAIRFYADEGVVTPTHLTDGGFRQYDVHAIARLELVRTLRDLGAGLDDIGRVLAAETTLHDLAATHLRLVEDRLRQFHARRAVLRTIVRQHTTTEQVTSEQLEAWIELAEMVRDEQFRTALWDFLHRTFSTEQGKLMVTPEMMARAERRAALFKEAETAQRAGVPADSPQAKEIAERMASDTAEFAAALTGKHDPGKARCSVADFDRSKAVQVRGRLTGLTLLTRYGSLVATINDTPPPDPDRAAAVQEWMAAALRQDTT